MNAHDAEEVLRPLLSDIYDAEEAVNAAEGDTANIVALGQVIVAQARALTKACELLGIRR